LATPAWEKLHAHLPTKIRDDWHPLLAHLPPTLDDPKPFPLPEVAAATKEPLKDLPKEKDEPKDPSIAQKKDKELPKERDPPKDHSKQLAQKKDKDLPKEKDPPKDHSKESGAKAGLLRKQLQGTWATKEQGSAIVLKLDHDKFALLFNGQEVFTGSYKLVDIDKRPKAMDLIVENAP